MPAPDAVRRSSGSSAGRLALHSGELVQSALPASDPRTLVVALRRWPLPTATRRQQLHLAGVIWLPARRLPGWLQSYLLVELPIPTASLPAIASPFRDDLAVISSSLAVQGVLAAIHGAAPPAPAWRHDRRGLPSFSWRKPGGSVAVSVPTPDWGAGSSRQPFAAPWAVVRELDDLDGDVFLIALAHALAHQERDGTTWITSDAILDDRGIQPKTVRVGKRRYRAGHRREDRARVAACMERLGRVWVDLSGVSVIEGHGRSLRRGRRDGEGVLLALSDRLVQGEGADELPVAWRYRPGPWITGFLTAPNRQVALLDRAIVRYDPYRQRWEKRLGRYLTFHLRMDTRRAAPLVRRLGPMIDELHLPLDRRHPERTRERCETALNTLARDGVIGAWAYTDEARRALAALPTRGWLEQWRAMRIAVEAPQRLALSGPKPDGIASSRPLVHLPQQG